MYHEGLLIPPVKIWDARRAAARHRAHHPHQQPPARAGARRHPCADRGDADGRRARHGAVRALRRRARSPMRFAAILKGAADELRAAIARAAGGRRRRRRASSTATASRSTSRSSSPSPSRSRTASRSFDFSDSDPQAQRAGQPAAVDGRGLRVLFADRQPRAEPRTSTTACATRCGSPSRRAPSPMPSRLRRSRATRWSISCWST